MHAFAGAAVAASLARRVLATRCLLGDGALDARAGDAHVRYIAPPATATGCPIGCGYGSAADRWIAERDLTGSVGRRQVTSEWRHPVGPHASVVQTFLSSQSSSVPRQAPPAQAPVMHAVSHGVPSGIGECVHVPVSKSAVRFTQGSVDVQVKLEPDPVS